MGRRWVACLVCALAAWAGLPGHAQASQLLDRTTKWQSIRVNSRGVALVTYWAHGRVMHDLVWGAKNALPPDPYHPMSQVRFSINYAGGYGSFLGTGYWKTVSAHNVCGPYTGPRLFGFVKGCRMPDGSYWALQAWQRDLPDNGWAPRSSVQSAWELHVSHWSGALPVLWFKSDWIYAGAPGGPFDHLYGRFTYQGDAVYGFSSTSGGAPTDSFGRLVAIDSHNPPWSTGYRQVGGWWRVNSFLTHRNGGDFCTGIYRTIFGVTSRTLPGRGDAYRITANGPGVTPVVAWYGSPPGYYQGGLTNLRPTVAARGRYSLTRDAPLNKDQVAMANGGTCSQTH